MSRFTRFAPLTGVVFFVLALAGAVCMGETPEFAGKPADFTEFFTEDKSRVILGSMLLLVSVFFLIWFLGTLATASGRAEGADRRVSRIAYGGGLVGAALIAAGMSMNMMGAFRVDEQHSISDDVAVVYGDLSSILAFLAAAVGLSVLLAGVAVVNARTRFLPAWLTWVSGIMAIGLFEPFFSFLFVIAFALWAAVVGSLLFFQQPDLPAEPAA
jgi:hypothetical protein